MQGNASALLPGCSDAVKAVTDMLTRLQLPCGTRPGHPRSSFEASREVSPVPCLCEARGLTACIRDNWLYMIVRRMNSAWPCVTGFCPVPRCACSESDYTRCLWLARVAIRPGAPASKRTRVWPAVASWLHNSAPLANSSLGCALVAGTVMAAAVPLLCTPACWACLLTQR